MKLNKAAALLCAAFIGFTSSAPVFPATAIVQAQSGMSVTESGGYMEGMYAEWTSTDTVDKYVVYYKETLRSSYTQKVDAQLIRRYADCYRVDVLGLPAGSYDIKIAAIKDGTEVDAVYAEGINVTSHRREGFAFSSASPNGGNASGGYNPDGSVPADAKIIYVTQDNIETVSLTLGKKTYTGLGNIIDGISKVSTPDAPSGHYIIRIIGKIDGDKIKFEGSVSDSKHIFYLQEVANVTVEGVGEDATMYRSAFVIKGSSNVELRNLGMMLFLDDGIAVESDNSNIWVHNNDIFYGSPGTDSDQVKGDGSLDIKDNSRYCTLSYNHFYDAGKALLVISAASKVNDTTSYLSYHHNWFDHSDSRHPRIRFASVHIYNNYYDGIASYGTGVTSGASAFVEANYYRNPVGPMRSSMQGNDNGKFSKEAGGIIKAYNNYFDGEDPTLYYSASTGSDFDAYLVKTRDEQVPSTVKTKLSTFNGVTYKNTYNNFDTAADMYEYTPDTPKDVASIVEASAGRVNGGDFNYEFDDSKADSSSKIDEKLKSLLTKYESPVVATYTGADGEYYPALGAGVTPAPTTAPTAVPTATPTAKPTPTPEPGTTPTPTAVPTPTPIPATELTPVTEKTTWIYENAADEYVEATIFNNSKIYANSSKNVNLTSTKYDTSVATGLKLNGGGVPGEYRCVEILPGVKGTLTVNFESTGGSSRTMCVAYNEDEILGEMPAEKKAATMSVEVEANKSVYVYSKSSSLTICSMVFTPSETVITPEPTVEPTVEPTAEPTATPTVEPTAEPTVEPTADPTATPTATPTAEPTAEPTVEPTAEPTVEPTTEPTATPTVEPTAEPTPGFDTPYFVSRIEYKDGLIIPNILTKADAQEAEAVIAQYDSDGRLIGLRIETITSTDTEFSVSRDSKTAIIKCFVWDSIVLMEPVSNIFGIE